MGGLADAKYRHMASRCVAGCSALGRIERLVNSKRGGRLAALLAWVMLLGGGAVLWMTALRDVWPMLDMVAPLSLHALAVTLIAAATLLLRSGRMMFMASSLGVVAITPSLLMFDARERPGEERLPWHRTAASSDQPPVLRVLAINAWHSNSAPDRLAGYIARADADIVLLSEFGPDKSALLQRLQRKYPHQASCAQAWSCSQVLLSRERFLRSGVRMPTLTNPPMVWAEFGGGASGAKVTVIGTHIYRPSKRHDWHQAQLDGLARFVRGLDGEVIVAGDFNMTRLSASFDAFIDATGLKAPSRVLASWPAWPTPMPLPQVQIDHIFVSSQLGIVDQRIGRPVGSDHLPLWTAIRLPQRATIMAGEPAEPAAEALR